MSSPLIVHIVNRLDYGGLENGLVNLVNGLPPDLCRHAIITLSGHSEFRQRVRRPDVQVHSIDKRPGKDFGGYWRMWRLLRRLRPRIVHTRNRGTIDMSWVAALAGVPIRIHGEHGWEAVDPQGENRRHLWLRRLCRPAITRWMTVSRDLALWLQHRVGVPATSITSIVNGVDTERFRPEGALPTDLPWQTRTIGAPLVFGTVGRLDPVKNQGALLEAFAQLVALAPERDLRLLMAGRGTDGERLAARGAQLGIGSRTWWAGARDDVPELMRAIDVFVLPSLNEGISNTVLEAMASGVPVVAADVGGNGELIEAGSNGRLYPPTALNELLACMLQYCEQDDLRRRHGLAAREAAVERLSLRAMLARYADFYGDLLQGGARG